MCWAYCAKNLLQEDLKEFVEGWNSHRMRKNRLADCPQGIPNDLHAMPQQFGACTMHAMAIILLYIIILVLQFMCGTFQKMMILNCIIF